MSGANVVNTPDTLPPVGKPPMVMRSVRVPEKLWNAARARCEETEQNISDVVRDALEEFVKGETSSDPE